MSDDVQGVAHEEYITFGPPLVPSNIYIQVPKANGANDEEPGHTDNPEVDDPFEEEQPLPDLVRPVWDLLDEVGDLGLVLLEGINSVFEILANVLADVLGVLHIVDNVVPPPLEVVLLVPLIDLLLSLPLLLLSLLLCLLPLLLLYKPLSFVLNLFFLQFCQSLLQVLHLLGVVIIGVICKHQLVQVLNIQGIDTIIEQYLVDCIVNGASDDWVIQSLGDDVRRVVPHHLQHLDRSNYSILFINIFTLFSLLR